MSELLTKLCAVITLARQVDQSAFEGWDRIHREIRKLLDDHGGRATTSPQDGYCREYTRIAGQGYATGAVTEARMHHEHIGNKILELEEEGKRLNQDNSKKREQVRLLLSDLLGPSLAFHLLK